MSINFVAALERQQISSAIYLCAAALLIFFAALLAGRRVQQKLPAKWVAGIAALSLLTLAFIWLLVAALNRKEAAPPTPPADYSAPTGTP